MLIVWLIIIWVPIAVIYYAGKGPAPDEPHELDAKIAKKLAKLKANRK
jgi:hypothetical protein